VEVIGIHDGSLEKLDLSEMSLVKALQFQVWFLPIIFQTVSAMSLTMFGKRK